MGARTDAMEPLPKATATVMAMDASTSRGKSRIASQGRRRRGGIQGLAGVWVTWPVRRLRWLARPGQFLTWTTWLSMAES